MHHSFVGMIWDVDLNNVSKKVSSVEMSNRWVLIEDNTKVECYHFRLLILFLHFYFNKSQLR